MQKIIKLIDQVKEIFFQITWPKKDALIQLSIMVISLSIVISLILGGFDYIFTNSIALLGNLNQSEIQQPIEIIPEQPVESTESAQISPEPIESE